MGNNEIDVAASDRELKQDDYFQSNNVLSILDALKARFGDDVLKVAEEANNRTARTMFRNLDIGAGDRTIEKLIEVLWEPMKKIGLRYTFGREGSGIRMNCTSCPLADHYIKLGAADWGYALHCACDASITEGFSDKIGFSRSRTLMQGHECCDHFYFIK